MSAGDVLLEVVRGWVVKAESDLENAKLVLAAGPSGPMDTVAFHAQQGAEKYLKALLCLRGHDVPRIHDIEELLARARLAYRAMTVEESRLLSDYATVTRYPGDYEPVTRGEARRALALARRVRAAVRKELPRAALRRGGG